MRVSLIWFLMSAASVFCLACRDGKTPSDVSANQDRLTLAESQIAKGQLGNRGDRSIEVEGSESVSEPTGENWAVVIGVNEYIDAEIADLRFCVADAKLFAQTLIDKCGYPANHILTITDDQDKSHLRPLKINLQTQIVEWLKNAQPEDTVCVIPDTDSWTSVVRGSSRLRIANGLISG